MSEPDADEVKDDEGYTWIHTDEGWSLKNHTQLCYTNQKWDVVQSEYGPMHLMG
jgi:hypothetical protein